MTPEARVFRPNRGQLVGWAGAGAAAVLGIAFLADSWSLGAWRTAFALWLFGLVIWANLLRPRVILDQGRILLRNAFLDVEVPAALVEHVTIRSYLVLHVGKRKYTGVAIGHKTRAMLRGEADRARGMVHDPGETAHVENYVLYVQESIEQFVDRAKPSTDAGGRVRRIWALVPSAAALVLAVGLAVLILV